MSSKNMVVSVLILISFWTFIYASASLTSQSQMLVTLLGSEPIRLALQGDILGYSLHVFMFTTRIIIVVFVLLNIDKAYRLIKSAFFKKFDN